MLDGRLDKRAWRSALLHDGFAQFLPLDRQPPPAACRATVQGLAEVDAPVIGIRSYDPAPSEIRAPLVRRDQVRRDQDLVAVMIAADVYVAAGGNEDMPPTSMASRRRSVGPTGTASSCGCR